MPEEQHHPAPRSARTSLAWAALAFAIPLAWQFLDVRYNRAGNWTALFITGESQPVPPELASGTYRFAHTGGYDGEMYRVVAHDPFLQRGFERYVDAPLFRFGRILVPVLAFALAGGQQRWIDASYIAVVALSVLLGSYWLSRWASLVGISPAWGLAFLLVPATLISMDRMTIDGALAALTVGFVYFSKTESPRRLYLVLVLACLTRETGVLLVAACCVFELLKKRFVRSMVGATACLPAALWWLWVSIKIPHILVKEADRVSRWVFAKLGGGIFERILHPVRYPFPATIELLTRSLDVVALAGFVCAMIVALILLRIRPLSFVSVAALLWAVFSLSMMDVRVWGDCAEYARVFSPLLILIATQFVTGKRPVSGWWLGLLPAALVDLRVLLELGSETLGILRGLLGQVV